MLHLLPRISALIISALPVHLAAFIFFQNLSRDFPLLAVGDNGLCVGLQNKIGHPVRGYRQWMQVAMLSGR